MLLIIQASPQYALVSAAGLSLKLVRQAGGTLGLVGRGN